MDFTERAYTTVHEDFGSSYLNPSQGFPRPIAARKTYNIVGRRPATGARKTMPAAQGDSKLKTEFAKLVRKWKNDTAFVSNLKEVFAHEAYLRIIGLGPKAVPLVIDELKTNSGHWFYALRFMTGKDPVNEQDWGNVPRMRAAWLSWWEGNEQNYR